MKMYTERKVSIQQFSVISHALCLHKRRLGCETKFTTVSLGTCIDCDAHAIHFVILYKGISTPSRILAHFNGECGVSLYDAIHSGNNFEIEFFYPTIFKKIHQNVDVSRTGPRVIWLQAIFNPLKRCHVSKQHNFFSIFHPCLSERTESHAKAFAIRVCTFSHFSDKKSLSIDHRDKHMYVTVCKPNKNKNNKRKKTAVATIRNR